MSRSHGEPLLTKIEMPAASTTVATKKKKYPKNAFTALEITRT